MTVGLRWVRALRGPSLLGFGRAGRRNAPLAASRNIGRLGRGARFVFIPEPSGGSPQTAAVFPAPASLTPKFFEAARLYAGKRRGKIFFLSCQF
jgi:hypothetical protein